MNGFSPPIEVLLEILPASAGPTRPGRRNRGKFRGQSGRDPFSNRKTDRAHLVSKRRDRDRLRNQVGLPSHGAEFYDLLPLSCEFAIHFEVRAQPVWVDRTRRGNSKRSCLSRAKVTKTSRSFHFLPEINLKLLGRMN